MKPVAVCRKYWDKRYDTLSRSFNRLKKINIELEEAVVMAYKKHHLDDPDIGWEELDDCLANAICNALGDEYFQSLNESVRKPKRRKNR